MTASGDIKSSQPLPRPRESLKARPLVKPTLPDDCSGKVVPGIEDVADRVHANA
jgi:hypothetical protein